MPSSPAAAGPFVPPRDALRIETPRGWMACWAPSPHVLVTEIRGFMSRDMALRIVAYTEPLYARVDRLHGFHNWFAMDNYESSCRLELTPWVFRHRAQTAIHIGLKSRMVAMGVSVANLAVGNIITLHPDLKTLEAALAATLGSKT